MTKTQALIFFFGTLNNGFHSSNELFYFINGILAALFAAIYLTKEDINSSL